MGNKQTTEICQVEKKKYTDEQQQIFNRYMKNPFVLIDKDETKIRVVIPIADKYMVVKLFDVDVIGDEIFFSTLKEAIETAEKGKENLKQLFLKDNN